jgi:hypothetical protein
VQGWGDKGYARIAMLTNGVGFEDRMSFPDVELNTVCAAKTPCKNGGEFDSSCNCRCNKLALWGGADCGTCSAQCLNGGKLNAATCSCTCPEGFFGNQCQAYVLIKWKGLSGSTGTITASWSLDHTYTGSYYNRRAAPAGQSGSDTGITGGDVTASGQTGSKDFTVNLLSYIPGYPAGWHYAFMNSQGQNEFGASRGFTPVSLASLNYDSSRKCLSGGNRPDAGATNLCPDATWATPTPPAVTPSVPATATPTRVPVAPSTGTPVSPATAAPTRVPSKAPVAPPAVTRTPVAPVTPSNGCAWADAPNTPAGVTPVDAGKEAACSASGGMFSAYAIGKHPLNSFTAGFECCGGSFNPATRAPTRVPSKAPVAPPPVTFTPVTPVTPVAPVTPPTPATACIDQTNLPIRLNGVSAQCSQLAGFCSNAQMGAMVAKYCPKSCGKCGGAPTPAVPAPTNVAPSTPSSSSAALCGAPFHPPDRFLRCILQQG